MRKFDSKLTRHVPAAALAAGFMIAAAACTAVNAVLVRVLTDGGTNPLEIAFFRNLFGLLFLLPWLMRHGTDGLRTRRPGMHLWRAGWNLAGMIAFFYAIALMPVADVVALNFTAPIFASVGAVLFLGEAMRMRRWSAVFAGFLGALVILRPGFQEIGTPATIALFAALSWALMNLIAKDLARTDPAPTIVILNLLLMTPASLLPALFVWTTPSVWALLMMAAHGVLGTVNQICVVRAFKLADTTFVMPFDFTRLPFVAVLAFLLFGEIPDIWTWIGAAMIFGANVYLTRRESAPTRKH